MSKLDRVLSLSPYYEVLVQAQPDGFYAAVLLIDGTERTAALGLTGADAYAALTVKVEGWQVM